jgi:hypothetical protein
MLKSENTPTKSIAIFLILVVGIFAINEYLYIHKHVFKNGNIVIHAHPFNKSQDTEQNKSHQHASGDLVFLTSLESFLPAMNMIFIAIISSVTILHNVFSELFNSQFFYLFNQERGPPIYPIEQFIYQF